jgi:hypothetical protein
MEIAVLRFKGRWMRSCEKLQILPFKKMRRLYAP